MIRTLALALGALNLLGNVATALFVIYAQEVLGTSTTAFAILSTATAIGGLVGGWAASPVIARLGAGTCLSVSVAVIGLMSIGAGLVSSWPLAAALLAIGTFFVVVWNVITVSFRQSVIPEHLLGHVNSVYRFFGWGAIPIGALIGGGIVAVLDGPLDREAALRVPWIVAGVLQLAMIAVVRPLTTERLEALARRRSRRHVTRRHAPPAALAFALVSDYSAPLDDMRFVLGARHRPRRPRPARRLRTRRSGDGARGSSRRRRASSRSSSPRSTASATCSTAGATTTAR